MSVRERVNVDSISGIVVLLLVAVFWLQREFTNPLVGALPDTVLVILTVLAIVLVVRGVIRPQSIAPFEEVRLLGLLLAVVLLAVWVLLTSPLGFLYSGIAMFFVVALALRERPVSLRNVIQDAVVSVLVVGGVYLVFTRLLLVPLPPNPF